MNKQFALVLLFFLGAFSQAYCQCSRSGRFVQSDPTYALSGTGSVEFNAGGTKAVVFGSDLVTVQGADLQVYLSRTDDILSRSSNAIRITTSPLQNDNGGTSPPQSPITGMKTFSLDRSRFPNLAISDYDFIVIQCVAINERWGYARLGAMTGNGCQVVGLEDEILSQIELYPNPTSDVLRVSNPTQNSEVSLSILDASGTEVRKINNAQTSQVDVSDLSKGVYFLQMSSDKALRTEQFIKQ